MKKVIIQPGGFVGIYQLICATIIKNVQIDDKYDLHVGSSGCIACLGFSKDVRINGIIEQMLLKLYHFPKSIMSLEEAVYTIKDLNQPIPIKDENNYNVYQQKYVNFLKFEKIVSSDNNSLERLWGNFRRSASLYICNTQFGDYIDPLHIPTTGEESIEISYPKTCYFYIKLLFTYLFISNKAFIRYLVKHAILDTVVFLKNKYPNHMKENLHLSLEGLPHELIDTDIYNLVSTHHKCTGIRESTSPSMSMLTIYPYKVTKHALQLFCYAPFESLITLGASFLFYQLSQ